MSQIRAFKISCPNVDWHGELVVFATSPIEARRKDGRDCDCEFLGIKIRRAKEFDELAPGPVTIWDYLSHGWHWGCNGCETHCYDDTPGLVIINDERVFCSRKCLERELSYWKEIRDTNDGKVHKSVAVLIDELESWIESQAVAG